MHTSKNINGQILVCEKIIVTKVQVIGFGYGDKVQKESSKSDLRFGRYGHLKFQFKSE